ncbi:MAG: ATP-binding protein [Desulfobacteraceae bacterium]|nr:ATP-binding protein [Desulfobacteraceae bacterium]
MTSKPVHIKVSSHPENLKQIRKAMTDATSKAGFSKEVAGRIILAVDEACSNVIRHSCKHDHTKEINLEIALEKECLTISIIDNGIKFDVNSVEARDVSEVRPGGLGLYIMEKTMDKVEYSRTPDGLNKLTLAKNFIDKK